MGPPTHTKNDSHAKTWDSSSPDHDYQITAGESVSTTFDKSTLRVTSNLMRSEAQANGEVDSNLVCTIQIVLLKKEEHSFTRVSVHLPTMITIQVTKSKRPGSPKLWVWSYCTWGNTVQIEIHPSEGAVYANPEHHLNVEGIYPEGLNAWTEKIREMRLSSSWWNDWREWKENPQGQEPSKPATRSWEFVYHIDKGNFDASILQTPSLFRSVQRDGRPVCYYKEIQETHGARGSKQSSIVQMFRCHCSRTCNKLV